MEKGTQGRPETSFQFSPSRESYRHNLILPAMMYSNLHKVLPTTETYSSIDIRIFTLEVSYVGMSPRGQLIDIVWPKAPTISHIVSTGYLVCPKVLNKQTFLSGRIFQGISQRLSPRSQSRAKPFFGICRVWITQFCLVSSYCTLTQYQ